MQKLVNLFKNLAANQVRYPNRPKIAKIMAMNAHQALIAVLQPKDYRLWLSQLY